MDTKKLIEEVLMDLGNNKTLTDVSSKIQIIVRLLGDEKLKGWYNCEFVTGYKDKELPDYRISQAVEIKADYFVPYGMGLMKVSGQSVPIANLGIEKYNQVMTVRFKDTISAIIEYSMHPENIVVSLNPYERILVQDVLGEAQIQSVHKVLTPSVFQTIIDNVQSRVIDLFMDLDEKVFNGQLDMKSNSAKEEIHQVINNNVIAGIVQTGSGSIESFHSTISSSIETPLAQETKEKILSLVNEIEKVAKDADEEFDDIAQEIVDIRSELQSSTPKLKLIERAFKAISWGASLSYKAIIDGLVKQAIDLLF